ncbi:uncharacterized protein LOC123296242 [Chrysoperla carnea]|uniref:uncharacterized protein LOC123296242 n=1 Tax=Chrysoperla carnea TaxID=189513 RepID=UPI001D093AFC|nr:uncharacterized protein LOC123296242 [Chrysoperla carnea]
MTLPSVGGDDNTRSESWDYKYDTVAVEDGEKKSKFTEEEEEKSNFTQEYISTGISSLGMLISGIQFAWIGPILPALLSGAFKIHITMKQSVWVMSLLQVGAVPGCILGSIIANVYGRRISILFISIPFIISSIVTVMAENVMHYYIARFISGISVGACFSVIPMYISEIASPEIRGKLGTSYGLSMSAGILLSFILGAYLPIVTNAMICTIFPIIMLILSFYLPETPYHFIIKQDFDRAEKTLKFLRKKSNVREELKRLIEGNREETAKGKTSFWDLLTNPTNRKSLIIICVLLKGQQWTGSTAIFGYSQVIFEEGHSSISAETCGVLLAVMNFAVVFLCGSLIDLLGRRKLLMISALIATFPLAMLGCYFYLQDNVKYEYIEYFRLTPLIAIVIYKFSYGIGLSPIPYVLLGEIFPTTVKAHAASFVSVYGSLVGVCANKMYELMYSEFSYPGTFIMYVGFTLLMLPFIYFMVPETKGLSLEEIQARLKKEYMMAQNKKENDYKYSEVLNEKPEEFELSIETKKGYYFQEWIVSFIASMLLFVTGIHYMWVSPILPALLNGSEKIHITTAESVTILGILNIGVVPGTIGGSMLADRFGRRLTLIWTGVLFVISGIILIFSYTAFTLCMARFLAGLSAGVGATVVLVYCSEIASPEIRGILLIVMTTFSNLGMVVVYFIGTFSNFQMNTIICCIFPVVTLLILFYIPESPYYLIYKKDYVNAEKSLRFLRGRSNVTQELKEMKEGGTNKDSEQTNNFLALFTEKTNRWALFMAGGLICCTELTATNVISQYCNVIFEKANSSVMSADAGGIVQSIINMVVVLLCGCMIEKVGRRVLLLASCFLSVFPLIAVGIFFYFQESGYPNIDQYSLIPFIGLTSLKFTVGLGIYCIPFIYIGELFPTNVKANASAICIILATVFNVLAIKLYQLLTDHVSYDIAFYAFALLCIASGIFVYVFVPETRGKSFEEIQEDLRRITK